MAAAAIMGSGATPAMTADDLAALITSPMERRNLLSTTPDLPSSSSSAWVAPVLAPTDVSVLSGGLSLALSPSSLSVLPLPLPLPSPLFWTFVSPLPSIGISGPAVAGSPK